MNKYEDEEYLDIDNYIFTEVHSQYPFFDWKEGEKEFGAFGALCKDGFSSFLKDKFIGDFITLRKNFITRDYCGIRFLAHKFKGSFKYSY